MMRPVLTPMGRQTLTYGSRSGAAWAPPPRVDNPMVKALARAFRWRKQLDEGVYAALEDLAKAKGVAVSYVSRGLRLTLLAPGIVEAILDGRQPAELRLESAGEVLAGLEGAVVCVYAPNSGRARERHMAQLKVTYFDFASSRGEEVRLALALARVPFQDNRIGRATFASLKPNLPFGALPVLEVDGRGCFGQSNAILRLIGRMYGLHPEEPFEAARHDALMDAAEDLRHRISPTLRMDDPAEKKAARQRLASDYIPFWGSCVDRQIGDAPFVGGARPSVADVKLYIVQRWISSGSLDDIPADSFDHYSRIKTVVGNVGSHPAIAGWYAARANPAAADRRRHIARRRGPSRTT